MPRKRHTDLDLRAVGAVLAVRAKLLHTGPTAPSDRSIVTRLQRDNLKIDKNALGRLLRSELPQFVNFRKQACDVDAALLETCMSIPARETCRALYHQVPKKGPPPFMPYQVEADIVEVAVKMQDKGFARSKAQVCAMILDYARKHRAGEDVTLKMELRGVSNDIWQGFMQRWGHMLSLRKGDALNGKRNAVTEEQIDSYAKNLDEWRQQHGGGWTKLPGETHYTRVILPQQVVVFDETGIQRDNKDGWVLCLKGSGAAKKHAPSNARESATVMIAVWADGTHPPVVSTACSPVDNLIPMTSQ